MDVFEKLTRMGDVTLYEPAGDNPTQERKRHVPNFSDCISFVQTPTGSKPVLKTMMTTACERNCFYCPFRAGRSQIDRVTVTPDDMAKGFDTLQAAKQVDGLFLSSGIIKGGVTSQDKILDTADIIRNRYGYKGYVHLKIMPGAEHDQLFRAMQLADRVSINLEAPTEARLQALAPKKQLMDELFVQLQRAHAIKQQNPHIRSSVVTQFVVGAVGDTDLELMSISERLYRQLGLARAYYSAFHPIQDTPFEDLPAEKRIRQNRLYQASYLLRDYAWELEELPFLGTGNLRTDVDPKIAWADVHLTHHPVDLQTATREELMRVPHIGAKSADAILKARQIHNLRDVGQLRTLGIRAPEQITAYILLDGKRPPHQLGLAI